MERVLLSLLLSASFLLSLTSAYYCDHDLCSATDEYCCGDNLCCDYDSSSSSFWLTVLIILLILAIIWVLLGLYCFDTEAEGGGASIPRHVVIRKVINKLLHRGFLGLRDRSSWADDPESSFLTPRNSTLDKSGMPSRLDSTASPSFLPGVVYHHVRTDSDGSSDGGGGGLIGGDR